MGPCQEWDAHTPPHRAVHPELSGSGSGTLHAAPSLTLPCSLPPLCRGAGAAGVATLWVSSPAPRAWGTPAPPRGTPAWPRRRDPVTALYGPAPKPGPRWGPPASLSSPPGSGPLPWVPAAGPRCGGRFPSARLVPLRPRLDSSSSPGAAGNSCADRRPPSSPPHPNSAPGRPRDPRAALGSHRPAAGLSPSQACDGTGAPLKGRDMGTPPCPPSRGYGAQHIPTPREPPKPQIKAPPCPCPTAAPEVPLPRDARLRPGPATHPGPPWGRGSPSPAAALLQR